MTKATVKQLQYLETLLLKQERIRDVWAYILAYTPYTSKAMAKQRLTRRQASQLIERLVAKHTQRTTRVSLHGSKRHPTRLSRKATLFQVDLIMRLLGDADESFPCPSRTSIANLTSQQASQLIDDLRRDR